MAANYVTLDIKWTPPKSLGRPRSQTGVSSTKGVKVLADGIQMLERELVNKARGVLKQEAGILHREAMDAVPVDLGELKRDSGVLPDGENTRIVYFRAPYALYVEYGTSGGGWIPWEKALAWVKRHGAKDPKAAARGLQIAVNRRGTRAQPFLFPAFERRRPVFVRRLQELFR